MENNRYGINWLGLFIKVIVFVVVVLLAIWLISKLTLRNKGLSFEENNKKFQDATVEFFKKNLPDKGDTLTVTLSQLITWDYLEELKNENGKTCDIKNSKSKIEVVEDYYSIKTILVCGNKSETTYIKLGNKECNDCDIKVAGLKEITKEEKVEETTTDKNNTSTNTNNTNTNDTTATETSKGSSSTSNSNNQNTTNNTQNQTILYEYVKETVEYTDWYIGKVTGTNIENSKQKISYSKYCKNESYTYRTVSYVTEKTSYSYKLELVNLDNVSSLELDSTSYFTSYSDYQKYVNKEDRDIEMAGTTYNGSTSSSPSAITIKNSSLDSSNFSYKVSEVYKDNGKYYVDITVRVKNLTGVKSYYASNIKSNIYYVPIKFTVNYVDKNNCITDTTANSSNYSDYTIVDTWNETRDVYRYKIITKDIIYSATPVEGYTKTGKSKIAG